MNDAYRGLIDDMAAFVRFAFENNLSNGDILTTLVHDIGGASREGLDDLFSPRVTGYAEREIEQQAKAAGKRAAAAFRATL